ncbi:MAG: archease [Thermodesulfobacteriota bacterium]
MPDQRKNRKAYRLIDHTADFGIRVVGKTKKELFENAGYALGDLIAGDAGSEPLKKKAMSIQGKDLPDLMVNWLRELLYLWTGMSCLVVSIRVKRISLGVVDAEIGLTPYDRERHIIRNEIKAVTYHQIQVNRTSAGWNSRIIFDV